MATIVHYDETTNTWSKFVTSAIFQVCNAIKYAFKNSFISKVEMEYDNEFTHTTVQTDGKTIRILITVKS